MAHTRGIEHLPRDALSEILIRVAGSSGGGGDIARAFSVSKTFRTLATDKDVLRAVSFEDLLQGLNGRYLLLSDVEGLVARCSRAGNLDAQLILAKVAIVSATALCNEKKASSFYPETDNYTLSNIDKAARFLNHFSAQNTDPSELVILVSNFLRQAEVRDLAKMGFHVRNFAGWFRDHGNKSQYQQFLYTFAVRHPPGPSTLLLVEDFNIFCILAHDKMQEVGVDEELISPLLECSVELNDDVVYKTTLERVDIAISIFTQRREVVLTDNNIKEMLWTNRTAFRTARTLREYLEERVEHEAYVQSHRGELLASFDALFNLQQGTTIDQDKVEIMEIQLYESDLPSLLLKVNCLWLK